MNGAERIDAERWRQVEVEGYTPEHDAEHGGADKPLFSHLLGAAVSYAIRAHLGPGLNHTPPTRYWPTGWPWKPSDDPIRNLERAGALIAAEIDRLLAERGEP